MIDSIELLELAEEKHQKMMCDWLTFANEVV